MIRGRLVGLPGRQRPFVTAHVQFRTPRVEGDVDLLIDTGADSTVIAPADALVLGIDAARLTAGRESIGVGGRMTTAHARAALTIGPHTYELTLRVLVPTTRAQERALARIPSLLGRDILARFALFLELRTGRVLLLDPHEAAALRLS